MPSSEIEIEIAVEDDPTPLVRAIHRDLADRLTDPDFRALTRGLRGTVAVQVAASPEAATLELDGMIEVCHGAGDRAQVTATVDRRGRPNGRPIEGEGEHPELAAWLGELIAAEPVGWQQAAARFWAALEPLPGAPEALLVVNLEADERERFGSGARAYEIRGRTEPLLALLEGRSALIEEAFERRIFIDGSFAEISVLTGAGFRVRMAGYGNDA